ncbi:MAG: VOC family protein [Paracoccus sp. (in: a-proteobacteria)]|nr:VOC family protein [Paracoccus sp. (in: a-proteobacteria)]
MSDHGFPCWFELASSDPARSGAFYGRLFGWTVSDSPMQGYHLAHMGDDPVPVAGVMVPDAGQDIPPSWTVYFASDDADAVAAATTAAGGAVLMGPDAVPGTGRFAVLSDPQGAVFGVLQPEPMETPFPEGSGAWNQQSAGRGNWLELMTTDPTTAFTFYANLFGWRKGEAMDMGEMGAYQMFDHGGGSIGGMMGLGDAPVPNWLPYFGTTGTASETAETIRAAGGHVHHGPHEVPGPAYIIIAQDDQGAWFATVSAEQ